VTLRRIVLLRHGQTDYNVAGRMQGHLDSQLTAEGRAFLACAMMEQENYAPGAIEKLLDPKAPSPECTCWWGSATRERAIRLLAWTRFKPKDKETTRLTQEILAARVHGAWRTTQENAWSLLALSQYFAIVEGTVKPVSGALIRGSTRSRLRSHRRS